MCTMRVKKLYLLMNCQRIGNAHCARHQKKCLSQKNLKSNQNDEIICEKALSCDSGLFYGRRTVINILTDLIDIDKRIH